VIFLVSLFIFLMYEVAGWVWVWSLGLGGEGGFLQLARLEILITCLCKTAVKGGNGAN